MRRIVHHAEQKGVLPVPRNKIHCLVGEHIGQIAPVRGLAPPVALDPPVKIIHPPAAKAQKLIEAAGVGMIAIVKRSIVPLADQPRRIPRVFVRIADGHLVERDAVHPAHLHRCQRAGAVRVTTREKRCPRRRAGRRPGVVLGQTDPLANQRVEMGRFGRAVVKNAEIAIAPCRRRR